MIKRVTRFLTNMDAKAWRTVANRRLQDRVVAQREVVEHLALAEHAMEIEEAMKAEGRLVGHAALVREAARQRMGRDADAIVALERRCEIDADVLVLRMTGRTAHLHEGVDEAA